jgi:hypothetical protein
MFGLTDREAKRRLDKFGENNFTSPRVIKFQYIITILKDQIIWRIIRKSFSIFSVMLILAGSFSILAFYVEPYGF